MEHSNVLSLPYSSMELFVARKKPKPTNTDCYTATVCIVNSLCDLLLCSIGGRFLRGLSNHAASQKASNNNCKSKDQEKQVPLKDYNVLITHF